MPASNMDVIVSLAKRRGFVFQSSEIYGGIGSTWDYGPLGVELKNNVKREWWRSVVYERDDMEGLDAAIIMNPVVWVYSGHVETFSDPLVDCRDCKARLRADKLVDGKCPNCGSSNLTEPRNFNLMFQTHIGPVQDESSIAYLRPETAQGIFVNFLNVLTTRARKLPFGIAQIGKAFRNEITPGNFTFRTREFDQMEIEYFCKPAQASDAHNDWIDARHNWYLNLGMSPANLRRYEQPKEELAHYAARTVDLQYRFFPEREGESAWDELEGIANRTDFDLMAHSKGPEKDGKRINTDSTADLSYFDEEFKTRFYPYVIEPSAGADRATLAFLMDAYSEREGKEGDKRVVLKLHPRLAPIKVAVLPLKKNKPEIVALAKKIKNDLQPFVRAVYDDTGAIGKLYARQDEVGTPYCVTVDFDSIGEGKEAANNGTVTIRDRDTWEQVRVTADRLREYLIDRLLK
ncbi:MAG TPA: glycine--tRNA ligase [Blastocatellia bacterium]|nr:glycine--tRNA ligase [Blastocatellia bacterium]